MVRKIDSLQALSLRFITIKTKLLRKANAANNNFLSFYPIRIRLN